MEKQSQRAFSFGLILVKYALKELFRSEEQLNKIFYEQALSEDLEEKYGGTQLALVMRLVLTDGCNLFIELSVPIQSFCLYFFRFSQCIHLRGKSLLLSSQHCVHFHPFSLPERKEQPCFSLFIKIQHELQKRRH